MVRYTKRQIISSLIIFASANIKVVYKDGGAADTLLDIENFEVYGRAIEDGIICLFI